MSRPRHHRERAGHQRDRDEDWVRLRLWFGGRHRRSAAIPERVGKRGSGTILVVEDEANIRTFSRRILEGAGFRVLDAVDGRDGLEVFAQSRAEIVSVLLDLTMPRMDGIEFLRQLRLLPAEVPVLLMSGYTEHEISGRVAELGVGAFLQKPFRQEDLLQKLEWLLTPAGRS